MKATAATPAPRSRASAMVLAAALAGGVASFAFGRLTAERPAPPPPARAARTPSPEPAPPAFPRFPAPPPPVAAPAVAPVSAAPPAARPQPAQSVPERSAAVAHATEETRSNLEALRRDLVGRCWPEGGLGRGRDQARLTFRVTFDAGGREIARAISEDRAAPAGAFGRCLRSLPMGSLSIEPPGRTIAVTVPFTFP